MAAFTFATAALSQSDTSQAVRRAIDGTEPGRARGEAVSEAGGSDVKADIDPDPWLGHIARSARCHRGHEAWT